MNRSSRLTLARHSAGFVAISFGLLLVGCTNLEAVRQFAKTSAATADYKQVVADYAESPLRRLRYAGPEADDELRARAAKRAQYRVRLEAAQAVLVKYMSALGDAAADDLPNVDDEIDGLTKALEGAKFVGDADEQIGTETATAAAAIAKVLVRVVLDNWRQREVREVVEETNGNIQVVVAGLKEVIAEDFIQALESEEKQIKDPFNGWIAAAKADNDPDGAPAVAAILLDERLTELNRKKQAAADYVKVLDTIGQGHHALATTGLNLDDEALQQRLKGYSKDLQTLYKSIKTLSN